MQILEELEHSRRGMYSGTIGFIDPHGVADFNVVIRSIIYNAECGYLSCHAGGGITNLSNPEAEYEECLVKVTPMLELVEKHFTQSPFTILPLKDEKAAS
jgi:para-aminobenzoate synthetase component I